MGVRVQQVNIVVTQDINSFMFFMQYIKYFLDFMNKSI